MKLRRPWQLRWAARGATLLLRTLGATWRVRNLVPEPPPRGLYLFLHGDLLLSAWVHRHRGYVTMIGTHRDGELIAQIAQRLGYRAVRGSTTRGGARAALELLRNYRDVPIAITPDGPRGPRGRVPPALVQLAALGGFDLVPLGFAASRARRFSSWDRMVFPLPFARLVCVAGAVIPVPEAADRTTCEAIAARAERDLEAAEQAAERALAEW